jgi:hypothetical protein
VLRHLGCARILFLPLFLATFSAAADLTKSSLIFSPTAPVEGDLIRYELQVRNTSAIDMENVEVRFNVPEAAHLIGANGLQDLLIESDDRRASGYVAVAAGSEAAIQLEVLTPRDSGGLSLTMRVRLGATEPLIEEWLNASVVVDDRSPEGGITVGGMRVLPAAIAVLVWMAATALVFLVLALISWRAGALRPVQAAVATLCLMFALGLWAYYSDMGRRDYQILNEWTETKAAVLSRRLDASSASSSSGSSTSRRDSSRYKPELALRYQVDSTSILSTGYDSGSALRRGGFAERKKELQTWALGTTIPAWYDPKDPRDVVVKRGYGGAYLFALFGVPPFLLGLWLTRRLAKPRQLAAE